MKAWRLIDWTTRPAQIVAQFQVEPRDLWVGVFWRFRHALAGHEGWEHRHGAVKAFGWSLHLYVCILPMIPLHIYIQRMHRP